MPRNREAGSCQVYGSVSITEIGYRTQSTQLGIDSVSDRIPYPIHTVLNRLPYSINTVTSGVHEGPGHVRSVRVRHDRLQLALLARIRHGRTTVRLGTEPMATVPATTVSPIQSSSRAEQDAQGDDRRRRRANWQLLGIPYLDISWQNPDTVTAYRFCLQNWFMRCFSCYILLQVYYLAEYLIKCYRFQKVSSTEGVRQSLS